MKSKHFQTLILLLIFVNFSNAQEKMYKIQFALHMGGVAEAESVADLYSTRDFLRVENKFMDKTVQISDFNKHKAYTLDYDNENYYEEELLSGKLTVTDTEDPISTADLQVEFITGESKSIAGYNCNKAIITLPIEKEESQNEQNLYSIKFYYSKGKKLNTIIKIQKRFVFFNRCNNYGVFKILCTCTD